MNENDRQAAAEAKRRRKPSWETTKPEEAAEQVAQAGANQLSALSDQLSDSIVDLIWAEAVKKALTKLSNGDMGKLAPKMLNSFESALSDGFQPQLEEIEEWIESPKYALPSTSEPDGSFS
jgi:acyl-CoA reductase-like NAD-dependent aldehyde dehydrogenase